MPLHGQRCGGPRPGSYVDLYAKRRAARLLATADEPADKPILRTKLTRIPIDLFLITLGGFADETTQAGKRRGWSEADDALLRELWSQPIHRSELVRRMKRSLCSIYRYAWMAGLPRRKQVRR